MSAKCSLLWPEGTGNSHPENLDVNKHKPMKKASATRSPNVELLSRVSVWILYMCISFYIKESK